MKLIATTVIASSSACMMHSSSFEQASILEKIRNMPDDVADAANIVIDYFKRESAMLMDVFPEEEEIEYEEEEEAEEVEEPKKFNAARTLQIMLNPIENTNRFLRYEFMKERNRISDGAEAIGIKINPSHLTCDKGWKNIDGLCWKYIKSDISNKMAAKANCLAKNGELVKPSTYRDNRNIASFMWEEEIETCVWLGINDDKNEGQFVFDNTNQSVNHTEFNPLARTNDITRNHVYFEPTEFYAINDRRWNLASNDDSKRCSAICIKSPGDRNRVEKAVRDPLTNVNRFLSLGKLDEFHQLVERKNRNGEFLCDHHWKQVGVNCYKLINEKLDKRSLKIECLKEGAIIAKIFSEEDNDLMLGFLDQTLSYIDNEIQIWIGINDGKIEGNYVFDNTIDNPTYFNWSPTSVENSEEVGSVQLQYPSGQWIRTDRYSPAAAICSKPIYVN